MRAISSTSASDSGLPDGSAILTEYAPPDALPSRMSSTRGRPANRGAIVLDAGSGDDGTLAVSLGRGGLGRTGSLDLGRARVLVPVAVREGTAPSTGGVPFSRGEVAASVSRDAAGSVAAAPGAADPRATRSGGAISVPRAGAAAPGLSAIAGPRGAVEVSEGWAC